MSGPGTIPEALLRTAERGTGEFVFHLEDGPRRLGVAELAECAQRDARHLIALGVEPGDTVGVLGPNSPEWVRWALATWVAGATVVPVQIPLRVRDPVAFEERLRRLVDAAECRLAMADSRLLPLLPEGVGAPWGEAIEPSGEEPSGPVPEDAAVIQFTSGSTAAPKGAVLSHRAVLAQMELLRPGYHRAGGDPRPILGWTPFFHDLGLFGNLVLPVVWGSSSHQLPTERFARDPAEWLRLVEATGAALTVGPSTAFGSALRAAERRGERPQLGSLEMAYFAAEGVDPDVARRLVEAAGAFGFREGALGSTYGLAEAVMAVSYSREDVGMQIDRVDLEALVEEKVARPAGAGPARTVVGCGPPLMELRIAGPEGDLPERGVGEILLRGDSTMSGYAGDEAGSPFADGWLRTGDLGYLVDGELYVTGRIKDVVIAMGHNYYPEDFEWAAARHPDVKPGRCAAFSGPGGEEVVVLVESSRSRDPMELAREVSVTVANAVGIPPAEVLVLPPGTLEKTTSGKLRRAAMRDAYLSGALGAVPA